MIHIKSFFEDGDVLGVSLQRRLNGKRRAENGERRTRHTPPLFCHAQFSSTRHTPPLCGTPLVEGRETESGERERSLKC
ncbi:MAG: hypothetical protein J6T88_06765 [Bacteroidales bacterium]|nr:hypothetical protein [Bacteroidales bacterium]